MTSKNYEPSLFAYSLSIAEELDKEFGLPVKQTLSQRDVPGMTRAVLPILQANNVSAISVGVNGGSCPPRVPKAFIWRDEESGTDMLTMSHPYGYPNNPGSSADSPGGISRADCVTVEGFNQALCWAFRTDNSGPPMSIDEVFQNTNVIQSQFPGARVHASTFDAFVAQLQTVAHRLPVVTSEIADVWIQGISSDPPKMAAYRALSRVRAKCLAEGRCNAADPVLRNSSFFLVKPGEHTWGLPGTNDASASSAWPNAAFDKVRGNPAYQDNEHAWAEQRQFNELAVEALGDHPLAAEARAALAELEPAASIDPTAEGYTRQAQPSASFGCGGCKVAFDADSGAMVQLDCGAAGSWASSGNPLAQVRHTTMNNNDYNLANNFCNRVFGGKPGLDPSQSQSKHWFGPLSNVYSKAGGNASACSIYTEVDMPAELVTNYGGVAKVWTQYELAADSGVHLQVTLTLLNKTSTRLPESLSVLFVPPVRSGWSWSMEKLASRIDPQDVQPGGNRFNHAVWGRLLYEGVGATAGNGSFSVSGLDVPLVLPIGNETAGTALVPTSDGGLGTVQGFAYNIYNNVWNTNYSE